MRLDVEEIATQEAVFGHGFGFWGAFGRTVIADNFRPRFERVDKLFDRGEEGVGIQCDERMHAAERNVFGLGMDGEGRAVCLLEEILRLHQQGVQAAHILTRGRQAQVACKGNRGLA